MADSKHPHKLSDHFTLGEFLSARDPVKVVPFVVIQRLERLCIDVLEPLRTALGQPLRVTSGWRSAQYNQAIGGAKSSQHVTGDAADLIAGNDEHALQLMALASRIEFKDPKTGEIIRPVGGLGYYPGLGFIHADQRARVAGKITTWMQVAGKYKPLSAAVKAKLKALGAVNL